MRPDGFERATGVNEATRQCVACGKFYRAANDEECHCPYCGSDRTRDIRSVATDNSPAPTRTRTVS